MAPAGHAGRAARLIAEQRAQAGLVVQGGVPLTHRHLREHAEREGPDGHELQVERVALLDERDDPRVVADVQGRPGGRVERVADLERVTDRAGDREPLVVEGLDMTVEPAYVEPGGERVEREQLQVGTLHPPRDLSRPPGCGIALLAALVRRLDPVAEIPVPPRGEQPDERLAVVLTGARQSQLEVRGHLVCRRLRTHQPGRARRDHHREAADVGDPRAIAGCLGEHDVRSLAQRLPCSQPVERDERGMADRLQRPRPLERGAGELQRVACERERPLEARARVGALGRVGEGFERRRRGDPPTGPAR